MIKIIMMKFFRTKFSDIYVIEHINGAGLIVHHLKVCIIKSQANLKSSLTSRVHDEHDQSSGHDQYMISR